MIDSLKLSRFRSIKDEEIDFRDINILIGRNNSGKSTVLYAMDLLINNLDEVFAFDNAETDLGSLLKNVFKQENSGEIKFDIRFDFDQDILNSFRSDLETDDIYSGDLSFLGIEASIPVTPNLEQGTITDVDLSSKMYGESGPLFETLANTIESGENDAVSVEDGFPPIPQSGALGSKSYIDDIEDIFRDVKNNRFFYIHPNRLHSNRLRNILDEPQHHDVGKSGRYVTDVMAYNRDYEKMEPNYEKALYWVGKFGFDEVKAKIEKSAEYSLQLVDSELGVQSNILDIGSGSNQLVSLITQSFFAPERSILVVEEPEIHLHPKYQARLADFFIDAQDFGNHQFFLETHSQHLLSRIQLRVAEGEIDPHQIGLFVFDKDEHGTNINQINIDSDGEVDEPIPGFFEQDFDDVMQRMQTISNKST